MTRSVGDIGVIGGSDYLTRFYISFHPEQFHSIWYTRRKRSVRPRSPSSDHPDRRAGPIASSLSWDPPGCGAEASVFYPPRRPFVRPQREVLTFPDNLQCR